MPKLLRFTYCFLFFLVFATPSFAQVKFYAKADYERIGLDERVTVSFIAEGANRVYFREPSFDSFEVIQEGTTNGMSAVNGKATYSKEYVYILQPKKTGKFYIPPATAQIKGKSYKTKPLKLEVVKSAPTRKTKPSNSGSGISGFGSPKASQGKPKTSNATAKDQDEFRKKIEDGIFVATEASKQEVYLGEQINIAFNLYSRYNLAGADILDVPDFSKFFPVELRAYNGSWRKIKKDKTEYLTKTFYKLALFPQQSGNIELEPWNANVNIRVEQSKQPDNIFDQFFGRVRTERIVSEALKIQVKSLPSDAPDDFNGAVGNYKITSAYSNTTLSTDDAFTLTLTITGDGDNKRVQAPTLILPEDAFDIYEPQIKESQKEVADKIESVKQFEYSIIPKKSGSYTLSPSFSYFLPDSAKYISSEITPITLNISQGQNPIESNAPIEEAEKASPADLELGAIKTKANLQKKGNHFFASILFWILSGLPFIALIVAFLYKRKLQKESQIDLTDKKKMGAGKVAQKRLKTAEQYLTKNESDPFYKEVSLALWGYISDKLNMPGAELSKNNVQICLAEKQLSQPLIDQFIKTINTCEMALFASMDNASAMNSTYKEAADTITEIEKELQ